VFYNGYCSLKKNGRSKFLKDAVYSHQGCGTGVPAMKATVYKLDLSDSSATQSTTYAHGPGPANLAIDGDTNRVWSEGSCSHTDGTTGGWWQVDLKDLYYVKKVTYKN
jgi:hypothetical protein